MNKKGIYIAKFILVFKIKTKQKIQDLYFDFTFKTEIIFSFLKMLSNDNSETVAEADVLQHSILLHYDYNK